MKKITLCIAGVLVFGLFVSGCGNDSGSAPQELNNGRYIVSGTITRETFTGAGLEGITVSLSSGSTMTVMTDANGSYQFSTVSKGSYTITASLSGYTFIPKSIELSVGDESMPGIQAFSGINFMAQPVLLGSGNFGVGNSAPRYIDNGDGTVTDTTAGLIWQKQDDGRRRNLVDAINYCDNNGLPGEDWRLPSTLELANLIDRNFYPAIDPIFSSVHNLYWSSDLYSGSTMSYIRITVGDYGYTSNLEVYDGTGYVRCVR